MLRTAFFEDFKRFQDHVGGFEFAGSASEILRGLHYRQRHLTGCRVRWLRGEYTTKTEARADLGVRRILTMRTFMTA